MENSLKSESNNEAMALYPYCSNERGHLKLLKGDRLIILKDLDQWVYARCLTNSCVGICPKCYVGSSIGSKYSILTYEARYLFKHVFTEQFLPTKSASAADAKIMDCMIKYFELMQYPDSNVLHLSKHLDDIRAYCGLPEIARTKTGEALKTHDLTLSTFGGQSTSSDSNASESKTTFQSEFITLSIKINDPHDLRICPRLYKINSKKIPITSPSDFIHLGLTNPDQEHIIKFQSLEATDLSTLVLEMRAFSYQEFGAKKGKKGVKRPIGSEYLGVSAEYLGTVQNPVLDPIGPINRQGRPLTKNEAVEMTMSFFLPPEGSPINTCDEILFSNEAKLVLSPILPQFGVKVQLSTSSTDEICSNTSEAIAPYFYPPLGTTSYKFNSLFVNLRLLKHKTSIKRTRVVVRVLDTEKKEFLDCFLPSKFLSDPLIYDSHVEKGSKEFLLDEIIQINLDSLFPKKCVIVFEVQRVSRSKGTVHTSSVGFHKMTDEFGKMIVGNNQYEICLEKPIREEMNPEEFAQMAARLPSKTLTILNYDMKLISTKYSSNEHLNYIINWEDSFAKRRLDAIPSIKNIILIDNKEAQYFYPIILTKFSEIMTMNEETIVETVMNEYTALVKSIDQISSKTTKTILSFFDHYIDHMFTPEHPALCQLQTKLLSMISEAFSGNKSDESGSKCQTISRIMPYFLRAVTASAKLENQMSQQSNSSLKRSLAEINTKLSKSMHDMDKDIISIRFIARSYWMLCDIIGSAFKDEPHEAVRLVSDFLNAISAVNEEKQFLVNQNRANLLIDLVGTEFLRNEITRSLILPEILKILSLPQVYRGFQADIFPVIQALFFNMVNNSRNLPQDILPFTDYIEDLLYSPDANEEIDIHSFTQHIETLFMRKTKKTKTEFTETKGDEVIDEKSEKEKEKYIDEYINQLVFRIVKDKGFKLISGKLSQMTPFNAHFIVLLLYYIDQESLKMIILKRRNPSAFFIKLLCTIKTVAESSMPPHITFITITAFNNIVSLVRCEEFKFLLSYSSYLMVLISKFYKAFLSAFTSYRSSDREFFSMIYPLGLKSIALIVPELISLIEVGSRFNADAFVPLFHIYLNTEESESRKMFVNAFKQLLDADYQFSSTFSRSENAIAIALDSAIQDVKNINDLFSLYDSTKALFVDCNYIAEIEKLFNRIGRLTTFMMDLLKYVQVDAYEDEQTTAICNILSFCLENNDYGLVPHFTAKLYDTHIKLNNLVEAAETLIQCAKVLKWDDNTILEKGHGEPEQPAKMRKQKCYEKAIFHLQKSFFYERALEVINELKEYFSNIDINYEKLSGIVKMEAECYKKINEGERNKLNQFYGVRFYGNSFSDYHSNKTFVYRRDGYFKSTDMMRKLQDKFPQSIVSPKEPSEEQLSDPNICFIYVFNMKPLYQPPFQYLEPPSEIMVKSVCQINQFYSEQPIRIRRPEGYGEFAEWHRFVYHYDSERPLQSYIRRSEIIKTSEKIIVTPIECAVLDTSGKTVELAQKASSFYRLLLFRIRIHPPTVSPFTMLINGIVNAAVNGGTKLLQDLFLADNNFAKEENNLKHANELKVAFSDQLKAVKYALRVHEAIVPIEFRPLHENCAIGFEKMVEQMEVAIGHVDFDSPPSFGELPGYDTFADFFEDEENEQ